MFFYITRTILPELDAGDEATISFLRGAAEGWRRGLHLVSGKPSTLLGIAESPRLCPFVKSIFLNIFNTTVREYTNYLKILKKVVVSMECIANERFCLTPTQANEFVLTKTHVILENYGDNGLYRILARYYSEHIGVVSGICYQPINGNGGQIKQTYEEMPQDTPCLCIVDSDKLTPMCRLKNNSTAYKITSASKPSILSDYYIIPVHERENLIPADVVVKYRKENGGISDDAVKLICDLQTDNPGYRYADLKAGMKVGAVMRRIGEPSVAKFWNGRMASFLTQNTNIPESCQQSACPNCKDKNTCNVFFIPRVGVSSNNVLEYITAQYDGRFNRCALWRLWKRIGEVLFSWACAPRPTAAI